MSETFPPRDLLENLGNVDDSQLARAKESSEFDE